MKLCTFTSDKLPAFVVFFREVVSSLTILIHCFKLNVSVAELVSLTFGRALSKDSHSVYRALVYSCWEPG